MLSVMAREFFASSPLMVFPVAALLLFLVAFSFLTFRALTRPRSEIEALANLPMDDNETPVVCQPKDKAKR